MRRSYLHLISNTALQIKFISYDIPFTGKHEPNKLTCSQLCDFVAQLVIALHWHRRGHGFESGWVTWNFSGSWDNCWNYPASTRIISSFGRLFILCLVCDGTIVSRGTGYESRSLFWFLSSHVIMTVYTLKWRQSSSFLWCDTICKISSVYGCDFERNIKVMPGANCSLQHWKSALHRKPYNDSLTIPHCQLLCYVLFQQYPLFVKNLLRLMV